MARCSNFTRISCLHTLLTRRGAAKQNLLGALTKIFANLSHLIARDHTLAICARGNYDCRHSLLRGAPMIAQRGGNGLMMAPQQSGVIVVRLTERAIDVANWPATCTRLKSVALETQAGIVVDCRNLPDGATVTIAAALYELLVSGRRRVP